MLVTGAGSGLGRAIAERLAERGDQVIGTVRDEVRARQLADAARERGAGLSFLPLELGEEVEVDALAERVLAEGGVDVVIHNAGFGLFGPIEGVDDEAISRQFAVNVFGPLRLTRKLLPALRARRGRVLWVGSLAGRIALPFQAHYSATKAAVAALSDAMRIELAPHGVEVCCIEPGDFATGFTDARQLGDSLHPAYEASLRSCLSAVEEQERSGPGPEWVARVVDQLSRARRLPPRRPVGRFARTIGVLRGVLPDRMTEYLVRQIYRC